MNHIPPTPVPAQTPYHNLGAYTRAITTSSPDAQTWFNRGLIWSYAFNHEEAITCFTNALSNDQKCAVAYWGLAYALGPNYNKPWEVFDEAELASHVQRTYEAITLAKEYAAAVTDVERALITALQHRFPSPTVPEDFSPWNKDYAKAMAIVYASHPDDLEVITFYADALMNLTPWTLWDIKTGLPSPEAETTVIQSILTTALSMPAGLAHPGLLHLYIHLMEMSPHPEHALPTSLNLLNLVPDSGHLNHMPSHLSILCGAYEASIAQNQLAIDSDNRFLALSSTNEGDVQTPCTFYTLYLLHNHHFLIYSSLFSARLAPCLSTLSLLPSLIPRSLLLVRSPPMADWLEGFLSLKIHVFIRFGLWEDLISLPLPPLEDRELYCVTTAMTYYGKGIAYAATSQVAKAEEQRVMFRKAVGEVPESRTIFNNTCTSILAIASRMLDAELLYRQTILSSPSPANYEPVWALFSQALHLESTLVYDEPWAWMVPVRHAYGALLLEQGEVGRATVVYEDDLGVGGRLPRQLQHLKNVWALRGLWECLVRQEVEGLGGGEKGDRDLREKVNRELDDAMKMADVDVSVSCFCRRALANEGEDKKCCQ